jgi:hypothetical protein
MAFQSDSAKEPKEVEALINEFAKKLDRLKILYEQYFMGIEKREPTVPLKDVVRIMRSLENEQIRNTGLRFRYRTLVQRLNTYRTYWNRTLREIERGTYHRDLARLRRKMKREGIEMAKVGPKSSVADVERAISDAKETAKRKQREGGITEDTARSALPPNPLAQIRGVSADQLQRKPFDEVPTPQNLGPMHLDEVDDEEETGRHQSGHFRAQQAQQPQRPQQPARRTPSAIMPGEPGDLPALPTDRRPSDVHRVRTRSSPDVQRTPSSPGIQRRGSSPDVQRQGRTPSSPGIQRRGSSPDVQRTPSSPGIQRRGSSPDVQRQTPSSPQGQRPPARQPSSPSIQRRTPSSPAMQGRARSSPGMRRPDGSGPSDRELKSLYQRFVRAKELCGEDTTGVRLDTLKKSIEHQMPKLRKMYKDKDVEFQVVIRSGRAILKAKPK